MMLRDLFFNAPASEDMPLGNVRLRRDQRLEQVQRIGEWKKSVASKPFSAAELRRLQRLSRIADGLLQEWAEQLAQIRERTTDPLPVWGDPEADAGLAWKPLSLKDRIQSQEVAGEGIANANARLRLKLAMDYWCALWFWPMEQAHQLPSREEWLNDLSCVLGDIESVLDEEEGQLQLLPDTQPKQLAVNFNDRHGYVNKAKLLEEKELRQAQIGKLKAETSYISETKAKSELYNRATRLAQAQINALKANPQTYGLTPEQVEEQSNAIIRRIYNQLLQQEGMGGEAPATTAAKGAIPSTPPPGAVQRMNG
mgnify:CR=1 FL=1